MLSNCQAVNAIRNCLVTVVIEEVLVSVATWGN